MGDEMSCGVYDTTPTRFSGHIEAPRWSGISGYLFMLASRTGVELSKEVDTGWFRVTIAFTVTGGRSDVEIFKSHLEMDLRQLGWEIDL